MIFSFIITVVTGERLETAYLLQRLSVAIHAATLLVLRTALYDIIVMYSDNVIDLLSKFCLHEILTVYCHKSKQFMSSPSCRCFFQSGCRLSSVKSD